MQFSKIPILNQVKFIRSKDFKKIREVDSLKEVLADKNSEIFALKEKNKKNIQKLEIKIKNFEKLVNTSDDLKNSLLNILEDFKESEEFIRTQKKILDDIVQYFLHGIILFGKNKKLLLANHKTFKIFDIKEADIKNKNFKILEKNPNYLKILEFLDNKNLVKKEFNFNKYCLKVNKIIFEKNKDIDYLIILNDITKEKDIAQQQRDFVALTAHQLRTPLSGIRWTLEMFLDGSLGKINKEQKEYINQLSINSAKLIKIVNSFLNIAQIEQGKSINKKKKSDIIEIINNNIDLVSSLLKEKKLKLVFDFSENIIKSIMIDSDKIKVVIQNLLENAIKYSNKESVIKISLKSDKKFIFFSIKNIGYGVPDKDRASIFTKFFRSSNIRKVDTEGSGLGLFVSKNIIEAHGGKIWFISEKENKSTIFYFKLPI